MVWLRNSQLHKINFWHFWAHRLHFDCWFHWLHCITRVNSRRCCFRTTNVYANKKAISITLWWWTLVLIYIQGNDRHLLVGSSMRGSSSRLCVTQSSITTVHRELHMNRRTPRALALSWVRHHTDLGCDELQQPHCTLVIFQQHNYILVTDKCDKTFQNKMTQVCHLYNHLLALHM